MEDTGSHCYSHLVCCDTMCRSIEVIKKTMTSGRYGIRKSVRAAAADYGGQCAPDTADPYMVVFLNLKVRCSVGSEAESMSFSHSISANPIA